MFKEFCIFVVTFNLQEQGNLPIRDRRFFMPVTSIQRFRPRVGVLMHPLLLE